MTSALIQEQAAKFSKKRPDIRPGFTVRVHERIQEGNKERVQVFEGLVIAMHRGHTPTDTTFTVRRIVSGIGVEKVFSLHSPKIEKIEVKKVAKIRRAKLYFLRGRRGKAARLSERFTTADEFMIATDTAEEEEKEVLEVPDAADEEAAADDAKDAKDEKTEEATDDPKDEEKAEKDDAKEEKAEVKEEEKAEKKEDKKEEKEEKDEEKK